MLFGKSDVDFSINFNDIIEDSLQCMPKDFSVVLSDLIYEGDSQRYGWHKIPTMSGKAIDTLDFALEASGIAVIFTDNLKMVRTKNFNFFLIFLI